MDNNCKFVILSTIICYSLFFCNYKSKESGTRQCQTDKPAVFYRMSLNISMALLTLVVHNTTECTQLSVFLLLVSKWCAENEYRMSVNPIFIRILLLYFENLNFLPLAYIIKVCCLFTEDLENAKMNEYTAWYAVSAMVTKQFISSSICLL